MSKQYYVYILTNRQYGTLYVGITGDLVRRIYEHRNDLAEGFTKQQQLHRLVWYEVHEDVHAAIAREKKIKKWHRNWKVNLIQAMNAKWEDLYEKIV